MGEANALSELGYVRRLTGDYGGAVQAQEDALHIYRSIGEPLGQANALIELGLFRRGGTPRVGPHPSLPDRDAASAERGRVCGFCGRAIRLGRRPPADCQRRSPTHDTQARGDR